MDWTWLPHRHGLELPIFQRKAVENWRDGLDITEVDFHVFLLQIFFEIGYTQRGHSIKFVENSLLMAHELINFP